MASQPKRRPINATSVSKEEVAQEKPSTVETPATEEKSVVTPPTTPEELAPATKALLDSDDDWERKIAEAKAAGNAAPVETETTTEISTATAIPAEESNMQMPAQHAAIDIEAEVERRVAARLAAANKVVEPKKETIPVKDAPSDEEIANKHAETAKKNNAAGLIFVNLGNDDDFEASIAREFDDDVRPDSEKTRNPSDYASGMALIREYGQRTPQQELLKEWVTDILTKNPEALTAITDKLRVNKVVPRIGNGTGPKKLSGQAAKTAVISRMKGMFRIQLYNSGFWIDICPPSLVDIDNWMQEVDQDFKELGRCLGGHAYTCIDVFLKKKLCEIIPGLVQRSNYENWENSNALMKQISYHDYDTLLWGLCCSMYKDGIGIGVYCTNPDCRHIDTSQYLDLARLCYLNTEKFPSAALEWMTANAYNTAKMLSDSDLANYRDHLLGFSQSVSVGKGTSVYELTVPSIVDFVDRCAALVGKITALTNGEKSVKSDLISNQLAFHFYNMMLPWVKSLSMNDENGNLIYKIEDPDAIYESLDIGTIDDEDFYKTIVKFIEDTKLSFYAAHTLECPKCGKKAELDKDNLFPLDLQYVFFGLCCLQMNQTGASF